MVSVTVIATHAKRNWHRTYLDLQLFDLNLEQSFGQV